MFKAEPVDQYGKTMSLGDDLIPTYLELCTDLPLAEVARWVAADAFPARVEPGAAFAAVGSPCRTTCDGVNPSALRT